MPVFAALVCIVIGGVINGSFALPTQHIRQWNFENVWLNYSVWAFLVLPWISIFSLAPNVWPVYQHIPAHLWEILLIGGALFGIGQACFAQALQMIGFGLGFVINIGLGTALGFLLPLVVLHPEKILTPFGGATLAGAVLITIGLLVSYRAGKQRDKRTPHFQTGMIFAIAAGICSAIQNFTFAATSGLQIAALHAGLSHLAAAMIIWPVFLTATFFPYAIYMLYLHRKHRAFANYPGAQNGVNSLLCLIMALCWYCSLVLYSQASLLIGGLGPVVGWPLFMVLIILMANFWGWRRQEWSHATAAIQRQALAAIGLLILAVGLLAYSATLTSTSPSRGLTTGSRETHQIPGSRGQAAG